MTETAVKLKSSEKQKQPGKSKLALRNGIFLVKGIPFTVKGVCYSPIKAGYSWNNYDWWSDPESYNSDFPLIASMGANCVRTFGVSNNEASVKAVLDSAAANGLYVIVGFSVPWEIDYGNAENRKAIVDEFCQFVDKWKAHSAVLIWCFGNEVDMHSKNVSGWYKLVEEACKAARVVEGLKDYHPIMTANQELKGIEKSDPLVPALDLWGLNVYRGKTFGALFNEYRSDKPFIMTEWGCDVFDARTQSPNEEMQSKYIESQWQEIKAHLVTEDPRAKCLGGLVFEWSDEWWKGASTPFTPSTIGQGGISGCSVHDTVPDWTNHNYEDIFMNEEWWGIVGINFGSYERTKRLSYYTLSGLWGGSSIHGKENESENSKIFENEIWGYQNTVFVNCGSSTKIKVCVRKETQIDGEIFTPSGEKIAELRDFVLVDRYYESYWNGKDLNGNYVKYGAYICKLTAVSGKKEEIRYCKIAII